MMERESRLTCSIDTRMPFMFCARFVSELPLSYDMITVFSFILTGRGNNTHAYTHSVGESHHVFLNLHTLRFYCLPDNYEIIGKFPPL